MRRYLGGYELLERLGEGGAGTVFRARGPSGEAVALKLFRGGRALTPTERRRFETEARTLTRLDHPHIVGVRGTGQDGDRAFLVMDLIQGESLQARLDRGGPLPVDEAVRLTAQLARALHHAHGCGVIHRDLKPDNVILDAGGQPRLTDFGLAKDLQSSLSGGTRTGAFLGTPGFWAPEQVTGERGLDHRADIYGLGATLYALLTGRPPIEAEGLPEFLIATGSRIPKLPSLRRAEVDPALDSIVLRCLAKLPGDRPSDAAALAEALESWSRGEEAPARSQAPGWVAALLIAAGVVGAGAIALNGLESAPAPGTGSPRPESPSPGSPAPSATPRLSPTSSVSRRDQALASAWAAAGAYDWSAARELLDEVLVDHPQDLEALCLVAEVRVRLNDIEAGLDAALRALSLDPSGERIVELPRGETILYGVLRLRAAQLKQTGDRDGARRDIDQLILLRPGEPEPWFQRAELEIEEGDFVAAGNDLTRYLQLHPDDVAGLRMRGIAFALAGKWGPSYADLDRALKLGAEPKARLYAGRAEAARNLGNLEGALQDFERALEEPDQGSPIRDVWLRGYQEVVAALAPEAERTFQAALAAERAGRREEALQGFARTAKLGPGHVGARYRLGAMANSLQQFEQAVAMFDTALELDPGHLPTRAERAIALSALRRVKEALADAEAVLAGDSADSDRALASLVRGRVRDDRGDPEGALRDYDACLEYDPGLPGAHAVRGLLLAAHGEHARAIADLSEALRRDRELYRVPVLVARGRAYEALDQVADARQDYQALLEILPSGARGRADVEAWLAGLDGR